MEKLYYIIILIEVSTSLLVGLYLEQPVTHTHASVSTNRGEKEGVE